MRTPIARIVLILLLVPSLLHAGGPTPTFEIPADTALQGKSNAKLALPAAGPSDDQGGSNPVQEMIRRFPAVEFDPVERAKQLGAGVEPAFEYVRDHIRYETYPGVLRGARGAYLTRAANAPDRAMLLAELLKSKGITTRFARGRLSEANAEILFNRIFEPAAPVGPDAKRNAATPSPLGLDFIDRVRARATRDFATLMASLGAKVPIATNPTHPGILAEMNPHTWLQAKVGEAWVDLDTAFSDAVPGKHYGEVDEVLDRLPEVSHQRVTIRVIAETLDGGSLRQATMLEVTRPVDSLLELQVFLVHVPLSSFKALGQAVAGGKGDVSPALWIDGVFTFGKPIAFDEPGAGSARGGRGSAVGDALDALGGGEAKVENATQFVAEFLEFTLTFPDGRTEITRRVLSDRGGAAWRATKPLDSKGLRPLARDDTGLVDAQTIHNIWFSAGRHDLAAYAAGLQLLINAYAKPADQPPSDFGGDVWPLALQNFACVLWGDHAFLPAMNDDPNVHFYSDSPRILLFSANARPTHGKPDKMDVDSMIDLRRDKIRGVAKHPEGAMAVARRKIWFGVLEGALEHETIAQMSSMAVAETSRVMSTSEGFTDSAAVAIRPADPVVNRQELQLPGDAAARLTIALAEGDTVVVPRDYKGDDIGWWAISAATGDTRAVWGQDLNAGVYNGGRTTGGSGNAGAGNRVDPATGKGMGRRRGSGGNEYGTVVKEVSIPGVGMVRQSVLVGVVAAVASAAAAIAAAIAGAG